LLTVQLKIALAKAHEELAVARRDKEEVEGVLDRVEGEVVEGREEVRGVRERSNEVSCFGLGACSRSCSSVRRRRGSADARSSKPGSGMHSATSSTPGQKRAKWRRIDSEQRMICGVCKRKGMSRAGWWVCCGRGWMR
jgi:hypothetical protein